MNDFFFTNKLFDENASFCIFKEDGEPYKFYYHPEGCLTNAFWDEFNGFIFHPFDANSMWPALYLQPSLYFESDNLQELFDFISVIDIQGNGHVSGFDNYEMNEKEYLKMVDNAIQQLNGDFKKVVLSRMIKKSNHDFKPFSQFIQLDQKFPSNYNYIFNSKQSGCWIGSSPEKFLKINQNQIETCALAGTLPLETEWTDKEVEEQQLVVDYVKSILEKATEDIRLENEEMKLNQIKHLRTNFAGSLKKSANIYELVKEFHPTPAVGGTPKKEAVDYIHVNEPHDRMYYTGFAGEICQKTKSSLFVNLRSFNLDSRNLYFFVGGGITSKSNSIQELSEIQGKFNSIS